MMNSSALGLPSSDIWNLIVAAVKAVGTRSLSERLMRSHSQRIEGAACARLVESVSTPLAFAIGPNQLVELFIGRNKGDLVVRLCWSRIRIHRKFADPDVCESELVAMVLEAQWRFRSDVFVWLVLYPTGWSQWPSVVLN